MRLLRTFVCVLAIGSLAVPVLAQDGKPAGPPPAKGGGAGGPPQPGQRGPGGGARGERNPPMTAAKAKSVWETQAKSVAHDLGLNDDFTGKTVAAYVEARQSFRDAAEKLRGNSPRGGADRPEGGDNAPSRGSRTENQKAMADLRKNEQEKLRTKLAAYLSADQVTKAMEPMGTFDVNWDRMVFMVGEFKLDEAKTNQALPIIQNYVVTMAKLNDASDHTGIQAKRREAYSKLTDGMSKLLTPEQMTSFERATGNRGRAGGNAPPEGPGGRGPRGGAGAGGPGHDGPDHPNHDDDGDDNQPGDHS